MLGEPYGCISPGSVASVFGRAAATEVTPGLDGGKDWSFMGRGFESFGPGL
jgi:hypothetical protein